MIPDRSNSAIIKKSPKLSPDRRAARGAIGSRRQLSTACVHVSLVFIVCPATSRHRQLDTSRFNWSAGRAVKCQTATHTQIPASPIAETESLKVETESESDRNITL